MHVLIVEDDQDVHQLLLDILRKDGRFTMDSSYSGTEALLYLEKESYDLLILDLMLPGLSGEEVLDQIKDSHLGGTIVLSAKKELEDKVQLLRLGADDYLTKPFHPLELLARIESVLRRYSNSGHTQAQILSYRQLSLDPKSRQAKLKGLPLELTKTEFDLLQVMVQAPHQVFSRESLYQELWGDQAYIEDNTINVHMSNLRKKFHQILPEETYIETVWGIGFKLV